MSLIYHANLLKRFGQTNALYGMIKEGDNVLVGLSGGKDSLTLLHLIARHKRVAPYDFSFHAVTVDYGMGENLDELAQHCATHNLPHTIIKSDIFNIAKEHIRENSSFCSFFSRMRRGWMYSYALENGYNKLALGHHLDDAAESFFMNLLNNGALRSLAPIYKAENGIHVIRPLIKIRERQTSLFVKENSIPTIGDEACPAMQFPVKMPYAREKTKQFLKELESQQPNLFTMLNAAFSHVHKDAFFDPKLLNLTD